VSTQPRTTDIRDTSALEVSPFHVIALYKSTFTYTHPEQSATSRHFSTISTDFPKKRLKPFLFSRSFPSLFIFPYSCHFVLGLAAFGLDAVFVN